MRIAVFVSGSGSNMMAIQNAIEEKQIPASIQLVLSNTKRSTALEKAEARGLKILVVDPRSFESPGEYCDRLLTVLEENQVEAVVLAGYLKMIPSALIKRYPDKILNIHPSLLPAFGGKGYYGKKVHEAVLHRGVKWTGVTIHLVSENYDEGPIVLQETIRVLDNDTADVLAARVLETEHKLYPRAVALLAENRIEVVDGKVKIKT